MADEAAEKGFNEQASALRDGVVDVEEYRLAFDGLRGCIEDMGYLVTPALLSPVTNTNFDFAYKVNGRDQDQAFVDYDACEAEFWIPVSTVYVDTAPQKMDPTLRDAVVSCMKTKALEADGSSSTLRQLIENGSEPDRESIVTDCTLDEVVRLFPDSIAINMPLGPVS